MTHQPRPARRPRFRLDDTRQGLTTRPRTGPVHDPQAYLEALAEFMAAARDHLDDAHYTEALPHLEQLRTIPEPRDPDHDHRADDERDTGR